MIQTNFRNPTLNEIKEVFNELYVDSSNYPALLTWTPYDFHVRTQRKFSVHEWKEFRLNEVVNAWFEEELVVLAQTKVYKLMEKVGDDKSTATAQALSQALSFLDRSKTKGVEPIKYIYTFIPLNPEEAKAENVRILENIPAEIARAIEVVRED